MAPKRKEVVPASPAKKRVRDAAADRLTQQLKEIDACLKNAPIAPELHRMLAATLPLSLGEFSDRRHKFQEQLVESIAGILAEVDASLGKEVAEARSRQKETTVGQPVREAEAAAAAERLREKKGEVQRLKMALAEKAMAFRAASAALLEAEAAKEADGQKAREAEKKKHEFEGALSDLTALKATTTSDDEVRKKGEELMTLLRKYKFEESMLIALPAALAKAPESRGQFDTIALTQLESDIGKNISEQENLLTAAKPSQERCDAAVQKARERLSEAKAEQRAAAKAFDTASSEQAKCETDSAAAQKVVRAFGQQVKVLGKEVYSAEAEAEAFQTGALATFRLLRERVAPVVEEPPTAALPMECEEAAQAQAPVPVEVA